MTLAPDQIRRRVKAARALAGLSIPDLAKAVDEPGLGDRTLRAMEGEKGRPFRKMELEAIARVCGVPYEFFTVDFARLPELDEPAIIPLAHLHGDADVETITRLADGQEIRGIVRDAVTEELREIASRLSPASAQDLEAALVASTRSTKQEVAEGPAVDDPRASEAAASTRGEGDATPGAGEAPDEAKPRSEGSTAP